MKKRLLGLAWAESFERHFWALTKLAAATSARALTKTLKPVATAMKTSSPDAGIWMPGVVMGVAGFRNFRLYRPPGVVFSERLPLIVMLHGCGQDANGFAASTRMNRIARRERFLVLYPEQDRLANGQGCWNWFDTSNGRAYGEVALIMQAVDQVCMLHPVDKAQVAIVGLSAGASMAALLVTRHPTRFKAVVMHSGIPPGTAHSTLSALGAMKVHHPTTPLAVRPDTMEAKWPPLLVIHGDADAVVSLKYGQAAVAVWAHAAGAKALITRSVQRGKRYPTSVTDFERKGMIVASLVAVHGLGHSWSGGTASKAFCDSHGPDASSMAWAFIRKQFHTFRSN